MRILCVFFLFVLPYVNNIAQAQTWQKLDTLGQILTKNQRFEEADSVLQIAQKEVEALHGKDTNYAQVVYNRGLVYFYLGIYDEAKQYWHEAKDIREKYLGKKSLYYARSCNGLAILYEELGLYNIAEPLYLEAKRIREEILGKKHLEYASSCNGLAILYDYQGFYDRAEVLYLEVKSIREEVLGNKHPFYAASCSNLAALYEMIGLYDKAEGLFLEARGICETVLGKKHLEYAISCHNLGSLYTRRGLNDKAELMFLEAKKIREELLGNKHKLYAMSCFNLGKLYKEKGMFKESKIAYLEAMDVQKNVLGTKHPDYAASCYNLASLYASEGSYNDAEKLYKEAKDIFQELYGKQHPDYALSCMGFADLYQTQAYRTKAEPYYFEAIQNKRKEIEVLFPIFSEQEKQAYWLSVKSYFERFWDFSEAYSSEKPAIMADLYNQILLTKGIIFSSTQKIKNSILNSRDTALVNQYNNWKKQRETYSKLYKLSPEEQKIQNLDLESMKNQINDLEKDLSKKSTLFDQNVQTKSYKWQEVKAKLAKNEAVIEIIKADSAYIALFLTAQTENYPAFYLFKNAQELEDKFLNYYKNCIEFKIEDTVSYNAFWKPIADKLLTLNKKGFKKIYLSPDGVFHQLSLNTLKNTKTGKFLLEEANIQLIGSSRDLIELNKKSRDLSQNYENYQAHLLGYPIYGAENTEKEPEKKRDRSLGFSGMQSAVGVAGSVSLLPGTRKEVEEIYALFNKRKLSVNLLLAENATEEALKNLKSPTILHVATHGFFIPEIKDSEVQDMQTAMNRNLLKNPFLRSGLLLAGCQKPNPEGEDGILTAEEVMNLTLDNTELVVMSACETGLGDIQAGEGVFGLQRAFQQAGAKSVLMSLWKVDDEATQTLMTEFYTALLKGQSKRQAFKTAQVNLKKRFPEPYYWGAFVMVGE